jgi:lysophospholipase L1-like esterase
MGIVFCCGAMVAGAALRPSAGYAWRWLNRTPGPAQPKLPNLFVAKAGQFALLDPTVIQPAIVYLGDSITDWIHVHEFVESETTIILNRAVSGDTTTGVTKRVRDSFPVDVVGCIVMIGYNDLSQGDAPHDVGARIRTLCNVLLSRGVDHIIMESVLPDGTDLDTQVQELNAMLALMGNHPKISYLDLAIEFVDNSGAPEKKWFSNSVHLSAAGATRRCRLEVEHLRAVVPSASVRMAQDVE